MLCKSSVGSWQGFQKDYSQMTHNEEKEEEGAVIDCDPLNVMETPDVKFQSRSESIHLEKIKEEKRDSLEEEEKEEERIASDSAEETSTNSWVISRVTEDVSIKREEDRSTIENSVSEYLLCCSCSQIFISKADLDEHMLAHRYGMQSAHVCQLCGEVFTTAFRLQNHFQYCPEKNSSPHTAQMHRGSKDNERLLAFSHHIGPPSNYKPQNVSKDSRKRFTCYECGKSFAYNCSLKIHMRDHTNERPYMCDICPMTFKRAGALKLHARHHVGNRPFSCEICGKSFTLLGNLTVHRRLHTGVRPYICDVCGKSFKQSVCLKVHLRTHTGVKPYKCEVCGRAFTQKGSLKIHYRIHTGERPYTCEACGDSFKRMGHLKVHLRLHNIDKGPQN